MSTDTFYMVLKKDKVDKYIKDNNVITIDFHDMKLLEKEFNSEIKFSDISFSTQYDISCNFNNTNIPEAMYLLPDTNLDFIDNGDDKGFLNNILSSIYKDEILILYLHS